MRYFAFICLFLVGCAGGYVPNYDYRWYKKFEEPYQMVLTKSNKEQLTRHCSAEVLACAVRLDDLKKCAVLVEVDFLPKWALEHEKRHCDGWSHDGKQKAVFLGS